MKEIPSGDDDGERARISVYPRTREVGLGLYLIKRGPLSAL